MYTYMGKVHCVTGWKFGVATPDRWTEYMFGTESEAREFADRMNQVAH
jgi:hypothetical protein